MKIDKKLIKELSEYLDEFKLTEIEFTEKDTKIKVSKNNISINNQTHPVFKIFKLKIQKNQKIIQFQELEINISNNWYCISCTRTRC